MSSDGVFDDDLMLSFDTSDVSPDELDSGGGAVDEECAAHLVVNGVTKFADEGKVPNLRVDMQVVASDKPGQVGKWLYHRIYLGTKDKKTGEIGPLSKESKKIMLRFAVGMGLIKKEDVSSPSLQIPFHLLKGRQCKAWIKGEMKRDETGKKLEGQFDYRIPFGNVWPPNHEHVEKIPADPEYLALAVAAGTAGGDVGDGESGGTGDFDF